MLLSSAVSQHPKKALKWLFTIYMCLCVQKKFFFDLFFCYETIQLTFSCFQNLYVFTWRYCSSFCEGTVIKTVYIEFIWLLQVLAFE